MGVNGLHKFITKRSLYDQQNGINTNIFGDLIPTASDKVFVGVDAFGWLYPAVRTKSAAASHHTMPPIPNAPALQAFKDKCRTMIVCGCIPVICLDGAPNPLKRDTFLQRSGLVATAAAKLAQLICQGRPQSFIEVEKLRQASSTIRPDLIADIIKFCLESNIPIVQAPGEAEHQLVELERAGLIGAIMSEDGDTLILGGQTVVTRVQWNYKQPSKTLCCIYRASLVWQRTSAGSGRWTNWLPELSCFLGNDYIDNLLDVGAGSRGPKLLDEYISQSSGSAKQAMLDDLEATKYWSKADKNAGQKATGFAKKFLTTAAFIRYCPVWRLQPTLDDAKGDNVVVLAQVGTFQISLEPLNPLPQDTSVEDWGALIGFDGNPETFLPQGVTYNCLLTMKNSARSGRPFTSIPNPTLKHPPYYQLAHGSYLDFQACPAELQPESCLKQFLFVRRLAPKGRVSRDRLVRLVKDLVALENRQPGSTARPMQLSQMKSNSASYQVFESLKPRDNTAGLFWQSSDVLARARNLIQIDDSVIDETFGAGRNGVRYRAVCRIRGGNFNVLTLQCADVVASVQTGDKDAVAFRIKTTPSMKSSDYWTTLVFDNENGGKLIPAPNSRCECPAGSLMCSHMLGMQAILYVIQQSLAHTLVDIAKLLPPPIKSVANTPIPWSFAFGKVGDDQQKQICNRLTIQTPQPKRRRRELVVLSSEGEESTCGTTQLSLGDAYGEPTQLSPSNVVDFPREVVFMSEEDDDDSSYHGNSVECESIDPEGEELMRQNSHDDASLEENAQCESTPQDKDTSVYICTEVQIMLAEAALRADKNGGYEHDYKVNANGIEAAINAKLAGIGGAAESPVTKKKQLEFHDRLHKLFCRDRLPKTVLSHYLLATEKARARWLEQLNASVDTDHTIIMPPVRLEKVPLGTNVLADRGFASCAVMYPFLNAMVTPFFLDGRDQFTMDEISADRTKCQLRWASEAVFSRVWQVSSLRDKVSRCFFEVLHEFVDWSHGLANLQQPFYKPGNDNYFESEWDGSLNVGGYVNYIDYAVPKEYIDAGMADTAVLKDGKDFVTDTIRQNPTLTRALYSDKVSSSGGRIITWALPTGLVFEHTGLFLGRVPEIRLVELWGRR